VASLETELGTLPPVVCDPGLMTQALVNLLVNAADAVEEAAAGRAGPGRIRIRTGHDGGWALVEVADDGPGIPAELRQRVFEPFFTTKAAGLGTGQGLPIARAIVEGRHGGRLTLETEAGGGATFTIRLPLGGPESTRAVSCGS
jgi:signal transduction histidine kinase